MRLSLPLRVASLLLLAVSTGHAALPEGAQNNRLRDALEVLVNVRAGRDLLRRAQDTWKFSQPMDLLRILRWGPASRTDAVLTRQLDPKTGLESRQRQITIYIRSSQALSDMVLDIAHELVHATAKPAWDPYDPQLTPGKYIWAAIEGPGGEVEAVLAECTVGLEVSLNFGASFQRCKSYLSADGKTIDRDRIRKDFYRVGKWDADLTKKLGRESALFPLLSQDSPRLYSSTGHAPYPAALLREFEELTEIACENSRRRVEVFSGRSPASSSPDTARDTSRFLKQRCE